MIIFAVLFYNFLPKHTVWWSETYIISHCFLDYLVWWMPIPNFFCLIEWQIILKRCYPKRILDSNHILILLHSSICRQPPKFHLIRSLITYCLISFEIWINETGFHVLLEIDALIYSFIRSTKPFFLLFFFVIIKITS